MLWHGTLRHNTLWFVAVLLRDWGFLVAYLILMTSCILKHHEIRFSGSGPAGLSSWLSVANGQNIHNLDIRYVLSSVTAWCQFVNDIRGGHERVLTEYRWQWRHWQYWHVSIRFLDPINCDFHAARLCCWSLFHCRAARLASSVCTSAGDSTDWTTVS